MALTFKTCIEQTDALLHDRFDLRQEILLSMVRQAEAAFADGADYVSLTNGLHEVGRIYRDGRYWSPPRL